MCQHIKIKCVFKWQVQPRGAVCVVTFPPLRTVERLVSGTYPAGSGSGRFIADWLWQVQCWLTVAGSVQIDVGRLSADWPWQAQCWLTVAGSVQINPGRLSADWCWQAQSWLTVACSVQTDNGRLSTDWWWQAQCRLTIATLCRLTLAGSVQTDPGRLSADWSWQVQYKMTMAGSEQIDWGRFNVYSCISQYRLTWQVQCLFITEPTLNLEALPS